MVVFIKMRLISFQGGDRGLWKEAFLPAPRKMHVSPVKALGSERTLWLAHD